MLQALFSLEKGAISGANGARNGARQLSSPESSLHRIASSCTQAVAESRPERRQPKSKRGRSFCTKLHSEGRDCIDLQREKEPVPPTGLEPVTFGLGNRRSIHLSYEGE